MILANVRWVVEVANRHVREVAEMGLGVTQNVRRLSNKTALHAMNSRARVYRVFISIWTTVCLVVVDCTPGACTKTCGGGEQVCERSCENGNWGQIGCEIEKQIRMDTCNEQRCPGYYSRVVIVIYAWGTKIFLKNVKMPPIESLKPAIQFLAEKWPPRFILT